jgi:hypothetical protein
MTISSEMIPWGEAFNSLGRFRNGAGGWVVVSGNFFNSIIIYFPQGLEVQQGSSDHPSIMEEEEDEEESGILGRFRNGAGGWEVVSVKLNLAFLYGVC